MAKEGVTGGALTSLSRQMIMTDPAGGEGMYGEDEGPNRSTSLGQCS